MHHYWFPVILITLPCAIQVADTSGGASVLMKLIVYSNSYGGTADGNCCDGFCVGNCDQKFKLCLHPYADPIDRDVNNCDTWETTFGPYLEQNINIFPEEASPFNIHVEPIWPGNIVFKVYVTDEDLEIDDWVDTLYSVLNETQPSIWGDPKFYRRTIYGVRPRSPTNLLFEYAVVCDRSFTGPYCNISCDDFSEGCQPGSLTTTTGSPPTTTITTTTSTTTTSPTTTTTTTTSASSTPPPTTKTTPTTTPTSTKSPSTESSTGHSDLSETHINRNTTTTESYPTTADLCHNGADCAPITCPGNYICYNGGVCQGGERAQSCQCTPCFAGPSCLMEICDNVACLQEAIASQCEVMGCKCSGTQDSRGKATVISIAVGVCVPVVIIGVLIALLVYFIKKSKRNDKAESNASGGTFDSFETIHENTYENDIYDEIGDQTDGVSYENEGHHNDGDDGYLRAVDVNRPGDGNTIPHDPDQTVPKQIYAKVTKHQGNEYSKNPKNTDNTKRGESDSMEQTIPKSRYSTKHKKKKNTYVKGPIPGSNSESNV